MGKTWMWGGSVALVASALLAGCSGGTSSSGVRLVTITGEELEIADGNRCAVRGNATNSGNVSAKVDLAYEARSATGAVIGTSTASFEVAPFSNFEFRHSKLNSQGQPSSETFTNDLACDGISNFKRTSTHTENS